MKFIERRERKEKWNKGGREEAQEEIRE